MKNPLQVTYLGARTPVFPTDSAMLKSGPKTSRWMMAYLVSLPSVYVTLRLWWELLPSYEFLFYMWMVTVPVGVAIWATQGKKKGMLMVALMAGFSAWACDFCLMAIIEGDG